MDKETDSTSVWLGLGVYAAPILLRCGEFFLLNETEDLFEIEALQWRDTVVLFDLNRAGGIEGGISNSEPIIVRAVMKPIPTLLHPFPSVDMKTGKVAEAHKERTDTCSVPSASIVGEAMLAISIGKVFCEKYGGDSVEELRRHFNADTAS